MRPRASRTRCVVSGPMTTTVSDSFTIGGDLEVRRLGFGAMRITGNGIWGPPDDPDQARAVLRRTLEQTWVPGLVTNRARGRATEGRSG